MFQYAAKVTNIIDGDTIDVVIDLGFCITYSLRIRLNGIDASEMRDRDLKKRALALKAKDRLVNLLLDKEVTLHSYKPDKYGRYLADIFINNQLINQLLINEGLAVPYDGGTR